MESNGNLICTRSDGKLRRRRTFIRLLAALVPDFVWRKIFSRPPQIYFNPALLSKIQRSQLRKTPILDSSNMSFSSFSLHLDLSNGKPDLVMNSTPKKGSKSQDARINALQTELEELRRQIAKIMEHHCDVALSSGYNSLGASPPLAPPPPPPPPPPPSTPCDVAPRPQRLEPRAAAPQPFGADFLRDLDKVKLRKVDKSPGGGPVKQKRVGTDPGDLLQEVLKRRFGVIQDLTPSSSPHSSVSDLSETFGCEMVEVEVMTPSAAM